MGISVAKENGLTDREMFKRPAQDTPAGHYEMGNKRYGKVIEILNEDTGEFMYKSFENIDKLRGPHGVVQHRMKERKEGALKQDRDVIIDMTMLKQEERMKMLEDLKMGSPEKEIELHAKVFKTKTLDMFQSLSEEEIADKIKKIEKEFENEIYGPFQEHIQVMDARTHKNISEDKEAKSIPPIVLVMLAAKYEPISEEEGFHSIEEIEVDHTYILNSIKKEAKEKEVKKDINNKPTKTTKIR